MEGIPEVAMPVNQATSKRAKTGAAAAAPVSGAPYSSPLNLFPQETISYSGVGGVGSLDFLRNNQQEILTSTSSMTSVPKPLKFLRPHYATLKAYYDRMADSDLKYLLADVLSVLAMTMSAEGERVSKKKKETPRPYKVTFSLG